MPEGRVGGEEMAGREPPASLFIPVWFAKRLVLLFSYLY